MNEMPKFEAQPNKETFGIKQEQIDAAYRILETEQEWADPIFLMIDAILKAKGLDKHAYDDGIDVRRGLSKGAIQFVFAPFSSKDTVTPRFTVTLQASPSMVAAIEEEFKKEREKREARKKALAAAYDKAWPTINAFAQTHKRQPLTKKEWEEVKAVAPEHPYSDAWKVWRLRKEEDGWLCDFYEEDQITSSLFFPRPK